MNYDPDKIDYLDDLRNTYRMNQQNTESYKMSLEFNKLETDLSFDELTRVSVAHMPRNAHIYYIHKPTMRAFSCSLITKYFEEVTDNYNWDMIMSKHSFLAGYIKT